MKVGMIINPESGKDIRRIVSDAFTVNNFEKLNIARRIINSALSISKTEFIFMPDSFGFGKYMQKEFPKYVRILEFIPQGEEDTVKATEMMRAVDVCCIVVLGGDGTNRLVAKSAEDTPIIPISTGTNNAFPRIYDGTIIGSAIGAISQENEILHLSLNREKRIEILKNGKLFDIALVDVGVIKNDFVGSKAVLEAENIKELFVSFGESTNIGLSSVFGFFLPIERNKDYGGKCKFGENGVTLKAPLMPGKLASVEIEEIKKIALNTEMPIDFKNVILSLDGERNIYTGNDEFSVRITRKGPITIDVEKLLKSAVERKLFTDKTKVVKSIGGD